MLKRISSFIFLVILSSSQIFSGAWTQKKNSGFYKIDFRFLSADKFYDADGNKINLSGKFKDQTLSFYGEFGFTDFLTVTASFPFYKSISAKQDDNFVIEKLVKANNQLQNSEEKLSGIGDIKIGLKLRLAQIDKTIISCGVSLGLPTGDYSDDQLLITGEGDFTQLINLHAGQSFYPIPIYANVMIAYQNRNEGYSDEFFYGIESGYTFFNKLTLIFRVHGKKSIRNGSEIYKGGYAGIFANNQEFLAYGPELVYKFNNNFGMTASFESGTAGKNIASTPVYAIGLFFSN